MSTPLLVVVTVIYLAVGISLAAQRRWGMALMFGGYSLANVGIIWDLLRSTR